jgi:hypothetical protein
MKNSQLVDLKATTTLKTSFNDTLNQNGYLL